MSGSAHSSLKVHETPRSERWRVTATGCTPPASGLFSVAYWGIGSGLLQTSLLGLVTTNSLRHSTLALALLLALRILVVVTTLCLTTTLLTTIFFTLRQFSYAITRLGNHHHWSWSP